MIINYLTKIIDATLTIIITETTKVFITTPFDIPTTVLQKQQSLQTSTPVVTIAEAKQSPKKRKVSIEGKVIQVCILLLCLVE